MLGRRQAAASLTEAAAAGREGGLSVRLPNIGNVMVASFWFIPMVLVAAAATAALALVGLEEDLGARVVSQWPFLLSTGPETARGLLSAIATTAATIAATTFSLTIVALTLAARQYTPKMLHDYMSHRVNQVALGVLAGTFVYAILVLQSVRSDPGFVPALALAGALALALVSAGVFIYFIHHLASALQDSNITADVEQRTLRTIERVFVGQAGEAGGEGRPEGVPVPAEGNSGYVQEVEIDELVKLMAEHDLVLTVERGAGEFVRKGAALARLSPPERASQEMVSKARRHFKIGQERTHQQDVGYGIYQLVDIAVRSLSPSFNAITTASTCIDHVGSILCQLAPMELPPRRCYSRDGKIRVTVDSPTFRDLLKLGFDQIRTSGESHGVILVRLLEVIRELEEVTDEPERRRLLVEHANHIAAAAERGVKAEVDREAIRERLQDAGARLRDAGMLETVSVRSGSSGGGAAAGNRCPPSPSGRAGEPLPPVLGSNLEISRGDQS